MNELLAAFDIKTQVPLARYSSWRVGGAAQYLFKPNTMAQLMHLLQKAPAFSAITWLGLGSNTLIRDKGVPGLVIITQPGLQCLEVLDAQARLVYAEAGVACGQLARFCARLNWSGAEFLAGIPGTIGGALRMNAGCFGGETWDLVQAVDMMDAKGQCSTYTSSQFTVGYRHVDLPSERWFTGALFKLQPGCKVDGLAKIRTLLAKRQATQPTGDHSCGSVFRNPPGDFAARLIEQCGLKGFAIGEAEVSTKHANFIINRGQASAQDIESLIQTIKQAVWEKFAVELQLEAQVLGL